ncbi:zeta toxin family protein [Candidatus Saccharibacteria bacterium]|nr:zeta toxin family protein [Candidatus Saccharibacteria bacterium]
MVDKKQFVLKLVEVSRAEPEAEPAGIFMAGLPGAGKTELSRNLIEDAGVSPLRIDMDEIAAMLPGYEPEKADEFRKPATKLLNESFSYALHHKISFLMDGTFGSKSAEQNIERSLKHGFSVQIVYAFQDPKLAWQFTFAREKVEHRSIKFEGFVEAYYNTIANIKMIGEKYGERISLDIAVKNPDNRVGKWMRNVKASEIDKMLGIEYNRDKLIKYILG